MLFSIIFSVDVPSDTRIRRFLPRRSILRKLRLTEGDEQYEFGYLGGCWAHGKHRKLCGILTRPQFDAFLNDTGLYSEDVETMGSLGAPGFGFGWAPAVSFNSDEPSAILNAYVTPIPEVRRVREPNEDLDSRAWERLRKTMIKVYKSGPRRFLWGDGYRRACYEADRRVRRAA